MVKMSYNSRKAAQTLAFFAKQEGGEIHVLKAIKMVYLADRESVRLRGHTMHNEPRFSLDHGPINSTTLDHINGAYQENQEVWQQFLETRAGKSPKIGIAVPDLDDVALDELSAREMTILQKVWNEFGHMDRFELAEWTHLNLVEWNDPNGSRIPISLDHMMAAVGLDHPIERAREQRSLNAAHDVLAAL
jgi:uncharacterized phage-associated protein